MPYPNTRPRRGATRIAPPNAPAPVELASNKFDAEHFPFSFLKIYGMHGTHVNNNGMHNGMHGTHEGMHHTQSSADDENAADGLV